MFTLIARLVGGGARGGRGDATSARGAAAAAAAASAQSQGLASPRGIPEPAPCFDGLEPLEWMTRG